MTFIVAEIGINWDGDLELARKMIHEAKNSGCDAVKFQCFNEEIVKDHPEKNRLIKSSISKNNIEDINFFARKDNIEWFCTPMSCESVNLIEPYMNKMKIRFNDGKMLLENKSSKLLDAVFKTNKDLIISTNQNPKKSKLYKHPKIKWLYVVPKYPCPLEDIDFSDIHDFNGYSNHCPNIIAPITASVLGSEIIEIHVTYDKNRNFIDNPVSFDFNDLETIINYIRNSEKIIK